MNGTYAHGDASWLAAAAVSKGQPVKFTGSTDANGLPTVTPCDAPTDTPIGVALTDCAANEKVAVGILGNFGGTILVLSGGAVAVGANVSPTGTSVDSGIVIGTALDAASGSGVLINVAHRAPITLS